MALVKAGFTVSVKPVGALRPHEEVIPWHVGQLAQEMERDGIQRDPVIVDRETLTVLDGMHRLAAFERLGVERAVCCGVDYASRSVSLGRWARVYSTGAPPRLALGGLGDLAEATLAAAFDALEGRRVSYAVLTSGSAYLPRGDGALDAGASAMRELDGAAQVNGWSRSFVPEDEVDGPLQDDGTMVFLLRKVTKDDVVMAAKSGRLLPCKTSMHVIDPRPVAVDFPISRLNSATDEALEEFLKGKEERLAPADTVYEGRRYKEKLLFLNKP